MTDKQVFHSSVIVYWNTFCYVSAQAVIFSSDITIPGSEKATQVKVLSILSIKMIMLDAVLWKAKCVQISDPVSGCFTSRCSNMPV